MDGVHGRDLEPRRLDPVELEAWIQVAVMLANLPPALDAQLQRDSGLSHFEYEVLSVLSDSRGLRLRMSELAALAGGSVSRLSHVVTRLERRGLVERRPCPDDARSILAQLTGEGRRTVVQAAGGIRRERPASGDRPARGDRGRDQRRGAPLRTRQRS